MPDSTPLEALVAVAPPPPPPTVRYYELIERVRAYDPEVDQDLLDRAYVFAMKMHGTQLRASGAPYISHPLEVAGILADMRLDSASIATALLHDVLEDTSASPSDMERLFGAEITRLVDGVTKLSRIELQSDQDKQAENFRKLVLAMSEDIRVLLVKLADRLHNMRTLGFIRTADKRRRIARETLDIYAPLAERIGMHRVKEELEDLAFAELNGDARDSILARLSFLRGQGEDLVGRIARQLATVLAAEDLAVEVMGREKSPYSIWRKMKHKAVSFEQLSDIMAFRVIVADLPDCYHALGVVHGRFPMIAGRFKDFISTPKPNGYKSLHTTVLWPEGGQRIEVQIRTRAMEQVADYGVAAHWSYKQQVRSDQPQYRWLRELLEILEHAQKPEEFLEHTKLELFQDQVFCFTPKGDLISLPRGACPIDFAYAVHSQVGDTCVGAKVNGRLVPLNSQLQNGDQVEIVTSGKQTPNPDWDRFVVSGKARAHIRRFVRQKQRTQYCELGRSLLHKQFQREDYEFNEKAVTGIVRQYRVDAAEDVYALIGAGTVTAREVFTAIFPEHRAQPTAPTAPTPALRPSGRSRGRAGGAPVTLKGLIPGMAVHFARCCHPLPGDRIVGIVTTGKGVTVHTIDCETLEAFQESPERWIDVAWDDTPEAEQRIGRLSATILNEPGSLGAVTTVIGKSQGNITNLRITQRAPDFWRLLIDVEVRDTRHLNNLIAALRATRPVSTVERVRGH